jgi:hypothetical protein
MADLPSPFHERLPYGERLDPRPVLDSPFFPFEGELRTRPLAEPVLPEPPREGAEGGMPCKNCAEPDAFVIWRDDDWRLLAGFEPEGLPMVAVLIPDRHCTLDDMPPALTASFGPMIQRVATAIRRIPGVGRTHFSRWGDGGEHFHVWFLARPLGQMQLRGASLVTWGNLLPKVPDEEFRANARTVAAALAEVSGSPQGIAS